MRPCGTVRNEIALGIEGRIYPLFMNPKSVTFLDNITAPVFFFTYTYKGVMKLNA